MKIKQIIPLFLMATMPLSVSATHVHENEDSTEVTKTSFLEMPNAFSPNGDGTNDFYQAKKYQNIESFHAYIFNRWGQKLYEWTDITQSWDGTHNGNPVKDGVYFVLVKARGTDGKEYQIRRDVNLLRKKNEVMSGGHE